MEFKVADKKDVPSLKEMWKDVFNDDDGYIDLFLEYKMKPEYTFIAVDNREIVGAVYSIYSPLVLSDGKTIPALYMCGICTKPEYRGEGIAGTLIENCIDFAKDNSIDLCYLIPANLSLFDFYSKFGFEKATYINKVEVETTKGDMPAYKTGYTTELLTCYKKLPYSFKPLRSELDFHYISRCYSEVLTFPEGYMITDVDEDTVYVLEQSFNGEEYAKIYAGNKNKKLVVYKPCDGSGTPFAVVKKLNKELNLPEWGYINLMLN